MNLRDDWRWIVTKAWSVRLIVLAAILSGLEVVLPLFVNNIPQGTFALASFLVTAAAFVARLVAQSRD